MRLLPMSMQYWVSNAESRSSTKPSATLSAPIRWEAWLLELLTPANLVQQDRLRNVQEAHHELEIEVGLANEPVVRLGDILFACPTTAPRQFLHVVARSWKTHRRRC